MQRDPAHSSPGDPVIEAYRRDVDETLIEENLRLTVEQRLVAWTALLAFAAELRHAAREAGR